MPVLGLQGVGVCVHFPDIYTVHSVYSVVYVYVYCVQCVPTGKWLIYSQNIKGNI